MPSLHRKYLTQEWNVCHAVIEHIRRYGDRNVSPETLVKKYFDFAIKETKEYGQLGDISQNQVDEWMDGVRQMALYRLQCDNDCK